MSSLQQTSNETIVALIQFVFVLLTSICFFIERKWLHEALKQIVRHQADTNWLCLSVQEEDIRKRRRQRYVLKSKRRQPIRPVRAPTTSPHVVSSPFIPDLCDTNQVGSVVGEARQDAVDLNGLIPNK